MSEHVLRIIPIDPEFVPPVEAEAEAVRALRSMLESAGSVGARRLDRVGFIDPGANFEGVFCPRCEADVTHAWPEWMSRMAETGRRILLPCCGAEVPLNDLDYRWPAGFARFVLEAANPVPDGWLPDEQANRLGEILRCRVRQILARV